MEKVNFLKLRESLATLQHKLQIYATFYRDQQFPMDYLLLKWNLKYSVMYIMNHFLHTLYKVLVYLKSHNKFYFCQLRTRSGLLILLKFKDKTMLLNKFLTDKKWVKTEMSLKQNMFQLKLPLTCAELHQMKQLFSETPNIIDKDNCTRERKSTSFNFKW